MSSMVIIIIIIIIGYNIYIYNYYKIYNINYNNNNYYYNNSGKKRRGSFLKKMELIIKYNWCCYIRFDLRLYFLTSFFNIKFIIKLNY